MSVKELLIIGILSTVVGGVILMIISYILRKNPFALFKSISSAIINFITMEITLPIWGLVIIVFTTILIYPIAMNLALPLWVVLLVFTPIIIIAIIKISASKKEDEGDESDIESYVEDIVFGMLWTWSPYKYSHITSSLLSLCPKCKRELTEIDAGSNYEYGKQFRMDCPNCDFKSASFQGEYYNLQEKVITEIAGRVRSGEYKEKLKS